MEKLIVIFSLAPVNERNINVMLIEGMISFITNNHII